MEHPGRLRRRHLLHEPGHLRDALRGGARRRARMRGVLALFEGVATGAADGYARMADRPACTLLHLGPGLGNGVANLHNARRARTPVVNIVGDHATYHKELTHRSSPTSMRWPATCPEWLRNSEKPAQVAGDAAEAVAAACAPPGQVATLVLPADVCWSPADGSVDAVAPPAPAPADPAAVERVSRVLDEHRHEPGSVALLLGGTLGRRSELEAASRIAAGHRGQAAVRRVPHPHASAAPACPSVERLAYLAEFAQMQLDGVRHLVLVGTHRTGVLLRLPRQGQPPGARGLHRARAGRGLRRLRGGAWRRSPTRSARPTDGWIGGPPTGPTDPRERSRPRRSATALGALMPEGAIVSDEGNTLGLFLLRGHRPARRRTTGCASPAAPSGRACPWPPARPWPAPTGA